MKDSSCHYVIAKAWNSIDFTTRPSDILFQQKISVMQSTLKIRNKQHFGSTGDRISSLTEAIDSNHQQTPTAWSSDHW